MTKKEAINIIDCYDIGFYDLSGEKIRADKLVEAFDMAIEALQAKPQAKWIPCNERLPSESGYYLATLKSPFETEMAIIWFAHIDDYGSKSEWREITDDDTVVAWMPLPEPWEGEDNED